MNARIRRYVSIGLLGGSVFALSGVVASDECTHLTPSHMELAPKPWPGDVMFPSTWAEMNNSRIDIDDNVTVFYGESNYDRFGQAVATGDFNGDGHIDLAISATYEDDFWGHHAAGSIYLLLYDAGAVAAGGDPYSFDPASGCVYKFRGLYGGFETDGLGNPTGTPGDKFGSALEFIDLDNDGHDDLVIGAPMAHDVELNNVAGGPEHCAPGPQYDCEFGPESQECTPGFPPDPDEYTITDCCRCSSAGRVFVIYGNNTPSTPVAWEYILMDDDDDGLPLSDPLGPDEIPASMRLSSTTTFDYVSFRPTSANAVSKLGAHIANAFDVNGDGNNDLLFTDASYDDPASMHPTGACPYNQGNGAAYLIYGRDENDGPDRRYTGVIRLPQAMEPGGVIAGSSAFFVGTLDTCSAYLAYVGSAGDFDGDGYGDLILGEGRGFDESNEAVGRAYIVFGTSEQDTLTGRFDVTDLQTSGPSTPSWGLPLWGEELDGYAGWRVTGIGNIDGVAGDEVAISAPDWDNSHPHGLPHQTDPACILRETGVVWILKGGDRIVPTMPFKTHNQDISGCWNLAEYGGHVGWDVKWAGDQDQDGYADFLISAPGALTGAGWPDCTNEDGTITADCVNYGRPGRVYLVYGGIHFNNAMMGEDQWVDLSRLGETQPGLGTPPKHGTSTANGNDFYPGAEFRVDDYPYVDPSSGNTVFIEPKTDLFGLSMAPYTLGGMNDDCDGFIIGSPGRHPTAPFYPSGTENRGRAFLAFAPAQQPAAAPDLDGDGEVTLIDLNTLLDHWHSDDEHADINRDGLVDVHDLQIIIAELVGSTR